MAGKKPSFITGASAKIVYNNITIAYASSISFSISVDMLPVEAIGRYEVISNEPLAYKAEGTLSIVRYTKRAANTSNGALPNSAVNGNDLSQWKETADATASAFDHFNPSKLLESETFELKVYQKMNSGEANQEDMNIPRVTTMHDCRFTSIGGSVNKRGVLVEQFSFNAILISPIQRDNISRTVTDTDLS